MIVFSCNTLLCRESNFMILIIKNKYYICNILFGLVAHFFIIPDRDEQSTKTCET